MITQHTANIRGNFSDAKNKTVQIRVDVPYQTMMEFLRRFHGDCSWWIEEHDNSIGVYVTGSMGIRHSVFAFGQGFKAGIITKNRISNQPRSSKAKHGTS